MERLNMWIKMCEMIGSGSVVTKDIPDNVIAVGNPYRVLRAITDEGRYKSPDLEQRLSAA